MEWWRKFPHGAKMARKYLAIPASTAPQFRRGFCTAKNILQIKRWSLLPERPGKCGIMQITALFDFAAVCTCVCVCRVPLYHMPAEF